MLVIVLCGGRGTRLGASGQKCCVQIAGRPFLQWKMEQLTRNGATEFMFLTTTPYIQEVRNVVGDWPVAIDRGRGQWHAMSESLDFVPPGETYYISNGDTWVETPLLTVHPPTMYVTRNTPEPFNVQSRTALDIGLYCVSSDSVGAPWEYQLVNARPFHLNTRESMEALCEAVDRLS